MNSKTAPRKAPSRLTDARPLPESFVRACRIVNRAHGVLTVLPLLWVAAMIVASLVFYRPLAIPHRGHHPAPASAPVRPAFFDVLDTLGLLQFVIVPAWVALTVTVKQPIVGLRQRWRMVVFGLGVAGIALVAAGIHLRLFAW